MEILETCIDELKREFLKFADINHEALNSKVLTKEMALSP